MTWNQQGPQGSPGLLNVHVATLAGALNSQAVKAAFAFCEPGEIVLGGGAKAFTVTANGEFNPVHVAITQSYPYGQGWGVYANETKDTFDSEWQLRAYAICATLAT